MYAIILVFDESERHKKVRRLNISILKAISRRALKFSGVDKKWLPKLFEVEMVPCCTLRNYSLRKMEILKGYLMRKLHLKKSNISVLLASQFENTDELKKRLIEIVKLHQRGDILFYYSGHGGRNVWRWGRSRHKKVLRFANLKTIFGGFKGRLILISEGCHSLAIERYLKELKISYLLFGVARTNSWSCMNYSVLPILLKSWAKRKIANPRVYYSEKSDGGIVDVIGKAGDIYNWMLSCGYGSTSRFYKRYSGSKMPSLRRGRRLDHLCFPVKKN